MKRFWICIAVAATLLSCAKEEQTPTEPLSAEEEAIPEGFVRMTVTVGYEDAVDNETKIALDGLHLCWQPGDAFGVSARTAGAPIYKFTTAAGGRNAVFTGVVPSDFKAGKAFYPYSAILSNSSTNNFRVCGVPASLQYGVPDGVDPGSIPMATTFENLASEKLVFYHLTSLMQFSVSGNDVCEIKLRTDGLYPTGGKFSNNDVKLHGALSLPDFSFANIGAGTRVFNSSYRGEGYVILRPSGRATFAPGTYYIAVAATAEANPRTLNNLTVTFTKTDGTQWSRSAKSAQPMLPGIIYRSSISETDCTREPSYPLAAQVGKIIPPWKKGCFDIHFINTMSGEGAFLILPDGTQMLIDCAGSLKATGPVNSTTNVGIRERYDPTTDEEYSFLTMFEEYIRQCMVWTGNNKIDYMICTHFHGDHYGSTSGRSTSDRSDTYVQQSMAYMLDEFATGTVIDRGYPDYSYPFDMIKYSGQVKNWTKALNWHIANSGVTAEKFRTGSNSQISLKYAPSDYSSFTVRNIGVNGEVWTGVGTGYISTFPSAAQIECANPPDPDASEKCPAENHNSMVMKFTYGLFDYWAGGDQQYNGMSAFSWKNSETAMAKACGRVDVMKADHHGTSNTNGTGYTAKNGEIANAMKYLDPSVWIVNNWVDGQPRSETYSGVVSMCPNVDTFITNGCTDHKSYSGYSTHNKGTDGHIVVRVLPGGSQYYVYVLNDFDRNMVVKTVCGPYTSR